MFHNPCQNTEPVFWLGQPPGWEGQPVNKEPEKCMALEWFTVHDLPDDIVEYPEAGLNGYLSESSPLVERAWQ